MTPTHRTASTIRVTEYLATAALAAGLAIGAAATAGAEWDLDEYDKCVNRFQGPIAELNNHLVGCCISSGGVWDRTEKCVAPGLLENVPGEPGQTTTPPVLQNPPATPSNPLVPTPRGPSSGTIG